MLKRFNVNVNTTIEWNERMDELVDIINKVEYDMSSLESTISLLETKFNINLGILSEVLDEIYAGCGNDRQRTENKIFAVVRNVYGDQLKELYDTEKSMPCNHIDGDKHYLIKSKGYVFCNKCNSKLTDREVENIANILIKNFRG